MSEKPVTKKKEFVERSLDDYLKERWMLAFIRDAGGPFMSDMTLYKLLFVLVLSIFIIYFTSFGIGFWSFILLVIGVFAWDFWERLKSSRGLIREVAGHNNAAYILNMFINSFYTEGMNAKVLERLTRHNKEMIEVRGRLDALSQAEIANKALKNDKDHLEKKEDLLKWRTKLNREQLVAMFLFCQHLYPQLISRIETLK